MSGSADPEKTVAGARRGCRKRILLGSATLIVPLLLVAGWLLTGPPPLDLILAL